MEMGFAITASLMLLALEWSNIFVYTCRKKMSKVIFTKKVTSCDLWVEGLGDFYFFFLLSVF